MSINLQFGLRWAIPAAVTCAWGARWIFPNDHLFDRQDMQGSDEDMEALKLWLNSQPTKAFSKSREAASYAADSYMMTQADSDILVFYKDARGVVVGSPNRSYGYVYVAAWLHNGVAELQPDAKYQVVTIPPTPKVKVKTKKVPEKLKARAKQLGYYRY
jgi:hypothetical protein